MPKSIGECLNNNRARASVLRRGRGQPGKVRTFGRVYPGFYRGVSRGEFVRRFLNACVLVIALIACAPGWAAGLGTLRLTSGLGQPFKAEVELVAVKNEEKSALTASLASEQIFRQANVNYLPLMSAFRASIEIHSDGRPYISITSSQPIAEPLLNLLVELNWSSGRVVREYPVVLAPPAGDILTHAGPLDETPAAYGVSAETQPGFSGAEAGTEKLKQTVSGKIQPSLMADTVSNKEKDVVRAILNFSKGMERQNAESGGESSTSGQANGENGSLQAGLRAAEEGAIPNKDSLDEANERIAQLEENSESSRQLPELKNLVMAEKRKQAEARVSGKGETDPLADLPRTAPFVPVQGGISRPGEAMPGDVATDKLVALAKPVQDVLMSVGSSDSGLDFLADAQRRRRSIMDELASNPEFLGGAIVLLVTGIVGVFFARRPREAEKHFGESGPKLTHSPTRGEPLPVIISRKAAAASPSKGTDAAVEFQPNWGPPNAQTEAIPQVFRNARAVEGQKGLEMPPRFSGLQGYSSSPPPIPPVTGHPSGTNPSTILRSNEATGVPLPERGIRWREIFAKLDLARAYQEMGDKDAALQVLKEVVRDGDATQRESARRIANL